MSAEQAIERVRELHQPMGVTESVIDWTCVLGDCEHDGECPEQIITPCRECSTPELDGDTYIAYPCRTIRALDEP